MKNLTRVTQLSILAVLGVACLLLDPKPIAADGAEVIDGPCSVSWNGSFYTGDGHWVRTPGGRINGHCHATLVSGPGESKLIHISFDGVTPWGVTPHSGVITPSGVLNVRTND